MHFKIKTHFRNLNENTLCNGCRIQESTTQHTLEYKSIIGRNEILSYIPNYLDLFGIDEDEQVYLARIIRENLKRLPA